jgi:hypothetical protein
LAVAIVLLAATTSFSVRQRFDPATITMEFWPAHSQTQHMQDNIDEIKNIHAEA